MTTLNSQYAEKHAEKHVEKHADPQQAHAMGHRRAGLSVGLGLAASLLTAACGGSASSDVDLSQLPIASETGSDLTWVRPSDTQVNCVRAPCPTHMLYNVNTPSTELVYAYDWRALQVTPDEEVKLTSNASQMLLYGRYAQSQAFGEPVQIFQVTRANQHVSDQSVDSPQSDRYYQVHADATCTDPACPALWAAPMNQNQTPIERWSGVDLSRLGLSAAAQQLLMVELQAGRAYVSTPAADAMPVVLSEAFRPYRSVPLP